MSAAEHIGRADGTVSAQTTHQLYQRYGRQIYAYCLHHLRSREEAEDAVQTTFLNAFRGLQGGTVAHSEQAWLYKIAQNVCLARHSSRARRLRLETPNNFEVLQETVASPQGDGADELIGIEDALEQMPENQRRAILLREWQGLSYREIAEELQLSQSAVEMLIFRARRALANALEQPTAKSAKSRIVSLGSLLAGLKSLLTGGAAIKAVALAFAAGSIVVAGEAEHTIVNRPAKHSEPAHASASAAAAVVPAAARPQPGRAVGLPVSGMALDPRAPGRARPLVVLTAHAGYRAGTGGHGPSPTIAPDPAAPAPSAPAVAPPQPQPQSAPPAPALPPPAPVQSAPAPQPATLPSSGDAGKDKGKNANDTRASASASPAPAPAAASPPKSDPAPQPTTLLSSGDAGKDKGKNGNDTRASASASPAPAPAAATPLPPVVVAAASPPPATQPAPAASGDQGNGNGNGNGKGHDGDHGHGQAAAPAPVVPQPTTTTTPVAPTTTTTSTTVTTTTTQAPPPARPPAAPTPVQAAPPSPSADAGGHGNGNGNGNGKGHGKDH